MAAIAINTLNSYVVYFYAHCLLQAITLIIMCLYLKMDTKPVKY